MNSLIFDQMGQGRGNAAKPAAKPLTQFCVNFIK